MDHEHGDPEEVYRGDAEAVVSGRRFPVLVHLGGRFEPIDGTYRWAGRLAAREGHEELVELLGSSHRGVALRHPDGHEATGALTERDPWGWCRVVGTGRPPFPLPEPPDLGVAP